MTITTCFSPSNYPLYKNDEAIIVVIDIFRATSAIVTAFANGVEKMIPVATVEEASVWQQNGCLAAAERNGEKIDGFDFGNSPLTYQRSIIENKTIAITTTNGTQAIVAADGAHQIIIGSFLNLSAVVNHLMDEKRDIVFLCAGWKNKFNIEDTLFAGAVAEQLLKHAQFTTDCDSTIAATVLYQTAQNDLYSFLERSSHRNRLAHLNLEADVRFCLQQDIFDVVPRCNAEGHLALK